MGDLLDGITWFGGPSVQIRRDRVEVRVDPIGLTEDPAADPVLLAHPHYDNFSEDDIVRMQTYDTLSVAPAPMKKVLVDVDHVLHPDDMLQLDGFDILAAPAYNVDRKFHAPERGWLGYVFTTRQTTYYHAAP